MKTHFRLNLALPYHLSFTWWWLMFAAASPTNDQIRIIGGKVSRPGAWPFMAALINADDGKLNCGGVVWNENTILTAGHCACRQLPGLPFMFDDPFIYLGHSNISSSSSTQLDSNYVFASQKCASHPLFHYENTFGIPTEKSAFYYDIGLIRLDRRIDFEGAHSLVSCVCDPEPLDLLDTTKCITMGWGYTKWNASYAGSIFQQDPLAELSMVLKEAQVILRDESYCAANSPQYNPNQHFCVSHPSGGPCKGDSGGPLLCARLSDPTQYSLVGLTVYGEDDKSGNATLRTCGDAALPSYYIKVAHYLDWIEQTIKQLDYIPWWQSLWFGTFVAVVGIVVAGVALCYYLDVRARVNNLFN